MKRTELRRGRLAQAVMTVRHNDLVVLPAGITLGDRENE